MLRSHFSIVVMHIPLKVIGLLPIWLFVSYNEAIEFKFTNAVCESYNKSWMVIHECRLRAVSRNKTTFNFNGTVLHPANDIHVRFELFVKASGYKPWLVNITVDGCRFIKKRFNAFAMLAYKLLAEFSNFNHSCPYLGPQIVQGFYPKLNYLPHAFPTGDYLLKIFWLFDKRPQFKTDLYYTFKEDLNSTG